MREQEIRSWIKSLGAAFRTPRPPIETFALKERFEREDISGLVTLVAKSMKLDMRLRIGYVRSGGPEKASAWIMNLDTVPMFGTEAFRRWMATICIRKDFLKVAPFEAVTFAIAHELSHIVLSSTHHPLKKVEEAVDLGAMFLGYRDIFVDGAEYSIPGDFESAFKFLEESPFETMLKNVDTVIGKALATTGVLGYMSRDEYEFARDLMAKMR
ncbi:MAG: hypothetical protein JWN50_66 [Parcubacteria group bacterium]|nr:hypothetical protein [Parcubacteria group bacterium]